MTYTGDSSVSAITSRETRGVIMEGRVRAASKKGYGFISPDDIGLKPMEFFFPRVEFRGHWNDLLDDFESGKTIKVEFEQDTPGEKGPRARNVRRLDWPNQ